MPRLKQSDKQKALTLVVAEVEKAQRLRGWDRQHLASLVNWYCKQPYQKLCKFYNTPEKINLGDLLDLLDKVGLQITVAPK